MRLVFPVVLVIFANSCLTCKLHAEPEVAAGLCVPDGFEVTLFAGEDLANDIYSMTLDAQGRVAVAGRGYVRLLIDYDGDGEADEARPFSDLPGSGAQGMYFDGNDLLATGDGALLRFRDLDGDGRADGPPERLLDIKTGGEHDTHAIREGPDGWWYLIAGNAAGVDERFASLATSPIHQPRAGAVYRLTPDFQKSEVIAHGFRNAYDFDFAGDGDIFVYDSDGERDVSLPWYRPTRVFHALPGSHAGWISRSFKRPGYFLDMPPVVGRFGRGSPTGVECYQHGQFPQTFQGALFIADWTFGRVIALPLQSAGSTYRTDAVEFMTGVGTFGFAPTDLAVSSDGSLFVSVGGRGTRGSVYRVRYVGNSTEKHANKERPTDSLAEVLTAPQPLSSWSRAKWEPLAGKLGRAAFAAAVLEETRSADERVRAIEILTERFGGLNGAELIRLAEAKPARVRARAAWAVRNSKLLNSDQRLDVTAAFLEDEDPRVARFMLESLIGYPSVVATDPVLDRLARKLDADDAYVRQTAARVAADLPDEAFATLSDRAAAGSVRAHVAALYAASLSDRLDRAIAVRFAAEVVANQLLPTTIRLDAARLAQLALGDVGGGKGLADVFDGYSGPGSNEQPNAEATEARSRLAAAYPTGHAEVDRELARALAVAGSADQDLLDRVLQPITSDSRPVADIHQLIVAARIAARRTAAQRDRIAAALVKLDPKIRRLGLNQDRHWDARIGELYAHLTDLDAELPQAIAARPEFGGPGSLLFLSQMSGPVRTAAVARIAEQAESRDDYPWSSDLVFALADSGQPEHLALIRTRLDDYRVRGAVLTALARRAEPANRSLFVEGLETSSLDVRETCLDALTRLAPGDGAREQAAFIKLVRSLGTERREIAVRDKAIKLLRQNTGKNFGYTFDSQDTQADVIARWTDWLMERHTAAAKDYLDAGTEDTQQFAELLEQVDWEAGDAARGEKLFAARSCGQCHQGRSAAGPDLAGVTRRFSRKDIFTAIVQPSRDVSSRYTTTSIETTAGRTYTGLVIYNSVDGVTLRDGLNQTIRIEADEIESQRTVNVSLMPTGLLEGLDSQDLADLYAYLALL